MSELMLKGEREALAKLIRQRERVAKTNASARSAHMLAEFEAQLDRRYSYDEDAVWEAAAAMAKDVVAQAQLAIAKRCEELGIPPEMAPGLSVGWYGRGRNAANSERAEMRRLAKRRIEEIESHARAAIEAASLNAQEKLMLGGLTSDAARQHIESVAVGRISDAVDQCCLCPGKPCVAQADCWPAGAGYDFRRWGPVNDPLWWLTKDGDKTCLALYERHYSAYRYRDGRKRVLFGGPGQKIVLRTAAGDAAFLWRKFRDDSGQTGINCAFFRNEGPHRASLLVEQADAVADHCWPGERHYTYVDPAKVRGTNPGYCFLVAGWRRCGITQNGKLILERP